MIADGETDEEGLSEKMVVSVLVNDQFSPINETINAVKKLSIIARAVPYYFYF